MPLSCLELFHDHTAYFVLQGGTYFVPGFVPFLATLYETKSVL